MGSWHRPYISVDVPGADLGVPHNLVRALSVVVEREGHAALLVVLAVVRRLLGRGHDDKLGFGDDRAVRERSSGDDGAVDPREAPEGEVRVAFVLQVHLQHGGLFPLHLGLNLRVRADVGDDRQERPAALRVRPPGDVDVDLEGGEGGSAVETYIINTLFRR